MTPPAQGGTPPRGRKASPAPVPPAARHPANTRAGRGRTVAWLHCFAGIAGDMAFASLLDAGADIGEVRSLLGRLPLGSWSLDVEPVLRGGIAATRAVVHAPDDSIVRTHAHVTGLIEEARLPRRVAARAQACFDRLATVEGRLHRRPASQVHFHEAGGHDTVVEVVGTAAALEVLGVDVLAASPVATGMGMVRTSHGMLPNPAPAVVELLRDVPTVGRDYAVELTTPTGAAIVATLATAFGPLPAITITSSGFGAGTRELHDMPNCTQAVVGEEAPTQGGGRAGQDGLGGQPIALIECNVDDATGETLAHAVHCALDAGALDAWITPIVAKKGRPAFVVSVLGDVALAAQLRGVLHKETGTFGVRVRVMQRWPYERVESSVDVAGMNVRVKVSPGRIKVEHDDAARVAVHHGLALRDVVSRAEAAWRDQGGAAEGSPATGISEDFSRAPTIDGPVEPDDPGEPG